jgi:hypothetical protein
MISIPSLAPLSAVWRSPKCRFHEIGNSQQLSLNQSCATLQLLKTLMYDEPQDPLTKKVPKKRLGDGFLDCQRRCQTLSNTISNGPQHEQ